LISDPKIQSAMYRIADEYVRMAHSAEIGYRLALAQRSFPAGSIGREAAFPAGRGNSPLPDTPTALQHNDFSANERAGFGPGCDPFPVFSRAEGKTPNSELSPECLTTLGRRRRAAGRRRPRARRGGGRQGSRRPHA
jgi:hypothetical protein